MRLWRLSVPTRAEVDAYQSVIDGLSEVSYSRLKQLLIAIDDPNPIKFRDALLTAYPELMRPFMSAASEVAAQWYSELRAATPAKSAYRATTVPLPPDEQLDATVRYAVTPLFTPTPQPFIGSQILSLLTGASQRYIANQGRDTIVTNSYADPVRTGWARIPQPGCCAFCGLMASRGATYRSEQSALFVVGRGVDPSETAGKRGGQGLGKRARGEAKLGDKYHNHCRCVAAPVMIGGDNAIIADTQQQYLEMYTPMGDSGIAGDGPVTLRATLREWRKVNGTK